MGRGEKRTTVPEGDIHILLVEDGGVFNAEEYERWIRDVNDHGEYGKQGHRHVAQHSAFGPNAECDGKYLGDDLRTKVEAAFPHAKGKVSGPPLAEAYALAWPVARAAQCARGLGRARLGARPVARRARGLVLLRLF